MVAEEVTSVRAPLRLPPPTQGHKEEASFSAEEKVLPPDDERAIEAAVMTAGFKPEVEKRIVLGFEYLGAEGVRDLTFTLEGLKALKSEDGGQVVKELQAQRLFEAIDAARAERGYSAGGARSEARSAGSEAAALKLSKLVDIMPHFPGDAELHRDGAAAMGDYAALVVVALKGRGYGTQGQGPGESHAVR